MILPDLMDEIATALETIPDLRVYAFPANAISPPAAEVLYPTVEYDRAFQRGLDRLNGGIIVSVGQIHDRSARNNLLRYVGGDDSTHSIHAALHARTVAEAWTSCFYARVIRAYGVDHAVGDVALAAYRFDLDIVGPGS